MSSVETIIQSIYVVAAVLFIVGLKRMSSPTTARTGIIWAGVGMLMATVATFFYPGIENFLLIATAIFLGTVIAGYTAKKVEMTEMPEMIALYNGMGGGAAAAIAAVELFKDHHLPLSVTTLALIGGIIGSISFTGSLIAFGKLQGMIKGTFRFKGQHQINILLLLGSIALSILVITGFDSNATLVTAIFVIARRAGRKRFGLR